MIAAGGGAVSVAGLFAADRVTQWAGKRFWGRLAPSSRVAMLLALAVIIVGVALPVPAVTGSHLARLVAGLCAAVFVFLVALQAVGILLESRRRDRYRGRHR